MAWGMGSFRGTKSSSPEASHPLVLSRWTAQHHRQEDKFRVAILGRVAPSALVGRKISCRPNTAASVEVVMLIGDSIRQEG